MRASIRPDTFAWKGMVSTCLLVATWLCVNIPSLQWLFHSFKQASHFNLILISKRDRRLAGASIRNHRVEIYTTLTLRPYPLLLMLGAAVSAIALQWLVDIEQITVILFVLGTYGLCGLFIQPTIWHHNDVYLYVTASRGIEAKHIDDIIHFNLAKITCYGTIQTKEMLRQFAQLGGGTSYDAILLVTDEGSYELSDDSTQLPVMPTPLWMVNLGGRLPPAYDDTTLKAIQDSGGGVSKLLYI